ncbi:MAG: hypothetical protein QXP73_04955 [Candidatus Methanomethylicaceae archaeon]|nr:hypothetical protein [Candidatus Verstraetearchaeota archaeon]
MGVPERLRSQTSEMAQVFVSRMLNLRDRGDLKPCFRCSTNPVARKEIMAPGEYSAVGVDGSMEYDELLEMMLFYACATGFRCPFSVGDDGRIKFHLNEVFRDSRLEASASVPLWMEDVSSVTGDTGSSERELIWSAEKVPFAIMTMAELYLALKAAEDPDVKVVFLDRPLHGTFSPLARDVRTILKNKRSALFNFNTSYGRPSLLDLGLVLVLGFGKGDLPSRSRYLPYLLVKILLGSEEVRSTELSKHLGLGEDVEKLEKIAKWLVEKTGEEFFEGDFKGKLRLKDHVRNYWPRMKELAMNVVKQIFFSSGHPLILGGGEDWLTVWDLNAVNLILVQMLRERSGEVLFVGIAKDTTASDFISCVVPYAMASGLVKGGRGLPAIRHDRAFLTILSGANPDICSAPWRTISYDSCFTTMLYSGKLSAARRRVSMERQFVKAYFQLREFQGDRELRSPTFLYDRFFIPEYDSEFVTSLRVSEGRSEITVSPYWEGYGSNPLDDLILALLSASDNPEVLEVMGHNQLLYLADKAVKTEIKMMKDLLRSVAELELGPLSRKYKLFMIARRFRDIRSEMERSRSRSGLESTSVSTSGGSERFGGF